MTILKVHKTHENHNLPVYATENSACFDISFQCLGKTFVTGFDRTSQAITQNIENETIILYAGDRILVPTGLIFILDPGTVLKLYARGSTGIKKGLRLANSVGIIDADYFHETFIPLVNDTNVSIILTHGDRLAQAEVCRYEKMTFVQSLLPPDQTTNRVGGFGSTGIN